MRANIVELLSLLHYRWVQVPLYSLNPSGVYLVRAHNYLRVIVSQHSPLREYCDQLMPH